jgi:hypothetical protein
LGGQKSGLTTFATPEKTTIRTPSKGQMSTPASAATPRYILMHDNDNVAIVVNDGGLPPAPSSPTA